MNFLFLLFPYKIDIIIIILCIIIIHKKIHLRHAHTFTVKNFIQIKQKAQLHFKQHNKQLHQQYNVQILPATQGYIYQEYQTKFKQYENYGFAFDIPVYSLYDILLLQRQFLCQYITASQKQSPSISSLQITPQSLTQQQKIIQQSLSPQTNPQLNPIHILLSFLLTIYIGLITSSTIKQTVTLFINQRQQGSRQYQYVMGLCKRVHTVSNVFYMMVFTSVFLVPFYLVVVYTQGKIELNFIFTFAAFVISSNMLTIALTSLFKQHKVATQVIGIVFSMCAFLPFVYKADQYNFKHYLAIIFPNSSFTLALLAKTAQERVRISFASLFFAKFYLLFFYIVQFHQDFLESATKCLIKCKKCLKMNQNQAAQSLINQQILSSNGQQLELQAASVLSSQIQNNQFNNNRPTLQLLHVRKSFGKVIAIQEINLKIYRAEILGLLGRNGAGKTTLVDMITKVTKPTSGIIKFNKNQQVNTNLNSNNNDSNSNSISVGICYQHQILYEDLTGIDHLNFYSVIKGVNPQLVQSQINRIVQKVGIKQQLNKKVKQLSGGNKRKLSFSIALLNSPKLLIFDEPTSGLDPFSRRNIWEILQQLRSADTTIILTTHHLDEADHLSDRICVIKKGQIIQEGTPSQIKQRHGKGFYLTLYHTPQQQQSQQNPDNHRVSSSYTTSTFPFNIKHYTKILTQNLGQKSFKISDKSRESIKYFINRHIGYKDLIKSIQMFQKIDGISVGLQANNLEQSFIALNLDIEEEGNSQKEGNQGDFDNNADQFRSGDSVIRRRSPFMHVVCQIWGIILKNFYCYIHKFHYFYNLNIIILVFVTTLNSLLISKLMQSPQLSQSLSPSSSSQPTTIPNPNSTAQSPQTHPLFLIQGYILMSSAFMSIPVLQKQDKIIHLLKTRGITWIVYWSGQFIFDFGFYWLNYIILREIFYDVVAPVPILLIASTGLAMILYSYTVSTLFNKVKTANSWFTAINSLLWLIILPLMLPDKMLNKSFYSYLKPLKYLSPYFDLSFSLLKQDSQIYATLEAVSVMDDVINGNNDGNQNNNGAGQEQYHYIVQYTILIYFVIFIVIQSRIFYYIMEKIKQRRTNNQRRRQQVLQQIRFDHVYKNYGKIQALKDVTYRINQQRVALLGHNGAGKSTTFGLLSAQLDPSSGYTYLQKKLKHSYNNTLNSTGICYQQDTLWKFMSPAQILKIFTFLIPSQSQKSQNPQSNNNNNKNILQQIFDNLDIQFQLKHRKFQNLSGGNKRKICMAVCLLGQPKIKLLDQCSTGLDPVSRLAMVNTIRMEQQGRGTVIFTTHSIPQAEQICSRVIVMRKGIVAQDGKIWRLKEKYYDSYWVQLVLNPSTLTQQNEGLSNTDMSLLCVKIFQNSLSPTSFRFSSIKKTRLQLSKSVIKLSQLMRALHKARARQIIRDFNIDQPKLEDIYLLLTGEQQGQGEGQGQGQRDREGNDGRRGERVQRVGRNQSREMRQIRNKQNKRMKQEDENSGNSIQMKNI